MHRHRKLLLSIVKIAIGVGLIAYLIAKYGNQGLVTVVRDAAAHWPWIAAGFCIFFVCLCLVFVRWQLLLRAQGIAIGSGRVFCITFIGHFFNSFMLGSTGGDVIKAFYASRESGHQKTEAISTVAIDRLVGLLGLLVLTDVVAAFHYRVFLAADAARPAIWFLCLLTVGTVAGMTVAFGQNIFERWSIFRQLVARMASAGQIMQRVYNAFYVYRAHPVVLAETIGLSVLNHVLAVVMAMAFAKSLQVDFSPGPFAAGVLVANMIGSIPISPGGLGLRENAYVIMLGALGVPGGKAMVMSLLVYLAMLACSLIGGVIFMFYSSSSGHTLREEMREIGTAAPGDGES